MKDVGAWVIGFLCLLGAIFLPCVSLAQPSASPPQLSIRSQQSNHIELSWTSAATGFVLDAADSLGPTTLWQAVPDLPQTNGASFTLQLDLTNSARFYRLRSHALTTIAQTSPLAGESGVSVTRETVLRFSAPLGAASVLSSASFYAQFGGRRLLTRPELSADRKTATLFYLENLPGSAQVQVTFVGDAIQDANGQLLDADGDGVPGGVATLTFITSSTSSLFNTAVIGQVLASERNPDGSNHPLVGVTVTVDGAEETLRAVTDTNGFFTLLPAPAGKFFVLIDGRTSGESHWPNGAYYPFVGKQWTAAAGYTNNLAGETGEIYLPLIAADALQTVSATTNTIITFAASLLATNPALAGVQLDVPANALFSENGDRGGRVGIAPVPPDRLPGPLPPGLNFPLVITIQTDGPQNFDQPVPIKFPNLPDPVTGIKLPPGSKTALWSFNHDTGRWEIQGPATVTADGQFVVSDPGVGVRQPGWNGVAPGTQGGGPPDPCPSGDCGQHPKPKPSCQANDPCATARSDFLYALDGTHANGGSGIVCDVCGDPLGYLVLFKEEGVNGPNAKAQGNIVDALYAKFLQCREQNPDPCASGAANIIPTQPPGRTRRTLDPAVRARLDLAIQLTSAEQNANTPYVPMPAPGDWFMLESIDTGFIQRGRINSQGLFDPIVLAPDEYYAVRYYDPVNRRRGVGFFESSSSGLPTTIPNVLPIDETGIIPTDSDRDGLPDMVELIIGTDPTKADTDGDGISDGVEVGQGSDPLDGRPAALGAVASVASVSPLTDLSITGDLLLASASGAGAIVYDVRDPLHPMVLSTLANPGGGKVVAVAADDSAAAMLDDAQAVTVLDLGNGSNARALKTVSVAGASALAAGAGRIYVGSSSAITVLDGRTGQALSTLNVDGRRAIRFRDNVLYALGDPTDIQVVNLYDAQQDLPVPLGQINPGRLDGTTLFVGGGYAYLGALTGFDILDVRNPVQPTLLGHPPKVQAAIHSLAANGSGLLVAVTSFNGLATLQASVYDVHNLSVTTNFLASFPYPAPGLPGAMVLHRGYAFVAETSGLATVNYLAADSGTNPPNINLHSDLSVTTGAPNGFDLFAATDTTDDVQVRTVEFYIDNSLVATAGTYPFETHLQAPSASATKTNFLLQAKATDTGGNVAWTVPQTVALVPAPPVLVGFTSSPRQPLGAGFPFQLIAQFVKPLSPASLTSVSCQFLTGNQPLAGGTITLENQGRDVTLFFSNGVPAGQYTFMLSTGITSLSGGIALPAAVTYPVTVIGPKLWISDLDGDWGVANNWSGATIPGTNDFVMIDRPDANPLIHVKSQQYCRSVISSENVDFGSGGTLNLEDLAEFDGSVTVAASGTGRFSGGRSLLHGALSNSSHLYLNSHVMELAATATPHYFDGFSIEPAIGSRTFHYAPAELHNLEGSVFEIHATNQNVLQVQIQGSDVTFESGTSAPVPPDLRSTFLNDGELRKTGLGLASINAIQFENNGIMDVREGTLQVSSALSTLAFNGLCRIESPATLQVNGLIASTFFGPAANFDGDGILELNGVSLLCDYSFAGLTRIVGGVQFKGPVRSAAPWLLKATATFSGLATEMTGPVTLAGAKLTFNSPTETVLPNLIIGPGNLSSVDSVGGTGKVRLTGALMVTNKFALGDSQTIQVAVDGPVDIRTNLTAVHVTFNAAVIWHSGPISSDVGLTISPSGSFELASTNPAQVWDHFGITNQGTMTKTSPGITYLRDNGVVQTLLNSGLIIAGAGQISLVDGTFQQPAGETRLAGGDIIFNNTLNSQFAFSGGRLTGAGVLGGNLRASGTAEISPGSPIGTLVVSNSVGPVTVTFAKAANEPGPQLTIDIAGPTPGTGFDQVLVTGSVSLLGTLNINLLNGYLPNIGDKFQILSCTSLQSGQFAQVTGAAFVPGKAFQVNYLTTGANRGVVLEVVASP